MKSISSKEEMQRNNKYMKMLTSTSHWGKADQNELQLEERKNRLARLATLKRHRDTLDTYSEDGN